MSKNVDTERKTANYSGLTTVYHGSLCGVLVKALALYTGGRVVVYGLLWMRHGSHDNFSGQTADKDAL